MPRHLRKAACGACGRSPLRARERPSRRWSEAPMPAPRPPKGQAPRSPRGTRTCPPLAETAARRPPRRGSAPPPPAPAQLRAPSGTLRARRARRTKALHRGTRAPTGKTPAIGTRGSSRGSSGPYGTRQGGRKAPARPSPAHAQPRRTHSASYRCRSARWRSAHLPQSRPRNGRAPPRASMP